MHNRKVLLMVVPTLFLKGCIECDSRKIVKDCHFLVNSWELKVETCS